MAKVLTFSRVFPSYHPKAGQPTYFIEKILRGLFNDEQERQLHRNYEIMRSLNITEVFELESLGKFEPKFHTIRAGHRWKAGDWFSPRVWSGKPYNSKQIQFAPDIQVKKIYVFAGNQAGWFLNGKRVTDIASIAANDGLELSDFCQWFKTSSEGQVICWSDSISY